MTWLLPLQLYFTRPNHFEMLGHNRPYANGDFKQITRDIFIVAAVLAIVVFFVYWCLYRKPAARRGRVIVTPNTTDLLRMGSATVPRQQRPETDPPEPPSATDLPPTYDYVQKHPTCFSTRELP